MIAQERNLDFFATFEAIAENECSGELLNSPYVYTDQDRVMQVLLGVQSNALKFTEKGKVEINVAIEANFLKIKVIDTGVGIAKED